MGFELHSDEGCSVEINYDHSITNYADVGSLEVHHFAWIIAGICACLACLFSFHLIYKHLSNYTKPEHQKHIVRILMMVPIYAIDSFLSFRFYWISVYFDVIRDCYEAFVIHSFYSLLIEYVGGYHHGKEVISQKDEVKLVVPLCCLTIRPKRGLMRQCKRLTLQYVVVRPAMTLLAVILHSNDALCPGNFSPFHGYVYFMIINFFSVTIAMYALVLFASVTHDLVAQYKPVTKFLSVKFVIMLSFWQAIVVAGFVAIGAIHEKSYWSTDNIATGVQNALLCLEMLIASIWHIKAFTAADFQLGMKTGILQSARNAFSLTDIAKDIYQSFVTATKKDADRRSMRKQQFMELDKQEENNRLRESEGEGEGEELSVRVSAGAGGQRRDSV